jgi:hypothetical protein
MSPVCLLTNTQLNRFSTRPPSVRKEQQNLSVQILAGALAAIVAALVGSTLGVAGTVLGAGIASVLTTLGAALYQRMHAKAPKWTPLVVGGLLTFVLGMLLITGLEFARGSQLSGGHGTTIGGIVRPKTGPAPSTRPAEVDINPAPSVTTTPTPPPTTTDTTTTPPPSSGVTSTTPPTTTPPSSSTTGNGLPPSDTGQ